ADGAEAGDDGLLDQYFQKPAAHALATKFSTNTNGQFGNVVCDIAVPTIEERQQPQPSSAQWLAIQLRDHAEVARSRPAGDVVRELRQREHVMPWPKRHIRPPVSRDGEHPGQEGPIRFGRTTGDHSVSL
ncbi:MAG: hypothetical protein JWN55_2328, partial [Frankiales bacterium]|nr:hypothetical protein [Frankiales bacterium]